MRHAFRTAVILSLGFHLRSALQWYIERSGESSMPNPPRIIRPRRSA